MKASTSCGTSAISGAISRRARLDELAFRPRHERLSSTNSSRQVALGQSRLKAAAVEFGQLALEVAQSPGLAARSRRARPIEMIAHHDATSFYRFDNEDHHGDPIGAVVRRHLELLAEHVGIDLFVGVSAAARRQQRLQRFVEFVACRRSPACRCRGRGGRRARSRSMPASTMRSERSKPNSPPPWR